MLIEVVDVLELVLTRGTLEMWLNLGVAQKDVALEVALGAGSVIAVGTTHPTDHSVALVVHVAQGRASSQIELLAHDALMLIGSLAALARYASIERHASVCLVAIGTVQNEELGQT